MTVEIIERQELGPLRGLVLLQEHWLIRDRHTYFRNNLICARNAGPRLCGPPLRFVLSVPPPSEPVDITRTIVARR